MMKKLFLVPFALLLAIGTLSAQKYGHLNFGNLVALMPETKAADSQLEVYQQELVAKGEEMVKAFEGEYKTFVANVQSGTITPKDQQTQQQALQAKQQQILAYEQEVIKKVEEKRNELLKPIIEKANAAVDEYAKANGYVMVFDTSVFNAVLYVQETDDLLPAVKAKLGIKE